MLRSDREEDVPDNDPGFIYRSRGPKVLWFANGGGGGGETDEEDPEEIDVDDATSALDAVSDPLAEKGKAGKGKGKDKGKGKEKAIKDTGSYFDDKLRNQDVSPRKLWSDVSKGALDKLVDADKTLESKLDAIFNQDLGDKLKDWGAMVKGGKPDRDAFLKADVTIADVISSYDKQLGNLEQSLDLKHGGIIRGCREALRAIARSMSSTTKYLDKKGLWKP